MKIFFTFNGYTVKVQPGIFGARLHHWEMFVQSLNFHLLDMVGTTAGWEGCEQQPFIIAGQRRVKGPFCKYNVLVCQLTEQKQIQVAHSYLGKAWSTAKTLLLDV